METIGKKEDGRLLIGQREPASRAPDGKGSITQRHRWTQEEIRRMGSLEFGELLRTDRNFSKAVDEFFSLTPPATEPPQS